MDFNYADDDDKHIYNTFDDCLNNQITPNPKILGTDEKVQSAYKEWTQPSSTSLLRQFEKDYECSGVCDVPLFYFTHPVSMGPPEQDCTEAVINYFTDNYMVAAVSCVGCFAFWAAAIASIPNCCRERKEKEAKKDKKVNGKHYELSEDVSGMNTTR